ncbi:glutamate-gated chloride channel-like [Macrosteles quadrilineatus]|uniref:glutamate-gated chloride channel-like n=1 Tax=Macrosteles quadrilineatus TaxID=74068 RepID=UPI0023E297EE|nr:glutamate-gated chloride channel-like [Macrosteles quadrilineatus]XP_054258269.1 glutamate-gated chloride channel-like [Macrosteles quadrilineatus]XP_054258270.1 glutamate-gated chloride channel-like [Macrosteles quadrilineatus]
MKTARLLVLCLIGFLEIDWSHLQATSSRVERKELLDKLLESYDPELRPSGMNTEDAPVIVKVNMRLKSINSISDYDMDYGIQIMLREEWFDERLQFKDKEYLNYLTFTDPAKIWTPDIFISNEKDSHLHKLMSPNHFVRIYPSGHILYSARLSLTLWCHMELENFPFDTQVCSLNMSAYGSTTSDVKFLWRESDAVQVSSNINIMGFTLGKVLTSSFPCSTNTGEYSCLKAEMHFKRDLKYYILHTFLPSTVLVVVSWASFWMDRRAVVARILLVLSTLFAMSSLATDIEASVPHVPYVKAMDLWAAVCFTFLLAALVEFAIINATSPGDAEVTLGEVRNDDGSTTVDMKPLVRKSTDSTQPPCSPTVQGTEPPFYQVLLQRLPRDPSRIDSVARVFFPSAFLVFFVLYFLTYYIFDSPSTLD